MKYYLGMFQQEETDALSCLLRHGVPKDKARLLVANAELHRSPCVFAAIDDERAILICPHPETGRLSSWKAIIEVLDSEAEADKILEHLNQQSPEKPWIRFAFEEAQGLHRSKPR